MSRRAAVIALAGWLVGCADSDAPAACHRVAGGALSADGLSLRLGSRVAGASLHPGPVGRCDAGPAPAAAFLDAHAALLALPPELRPRQVDVHWMIARGAARRIEVHAESRSVLLAGGNEPLSRTVWLHELGHVWAAGARPPGRLGRSVLAAVDEGFADYYAALVNRSPRVGGRDELRDLERPPPPAAAAWAELALAPEGFDPHRLGHGLAASLWALEPANTGLLLDLHTGLASDATYTGVPDTPGAVIEELARRIPNRSRARFEQAVAAWAPAEVLGGLASVDSARAAPGKMRGAHGP
ncbi:MAG: hypothetical protein HS104_39365 [Polyangiaceae bacterium]|nr:hypothetical protein [Polyangiaceae bacterium]MCL4756272.1 hypothetical protein [Myxococcales bacterium]